MSQQDQQITTTEQPGKNIFAGTTAAAPSIAGNAVAQSDQQKVIAEVQAAMMIAQACPRNQIHAMDRILNACARPTLAEKAMYQYPRGGMQVSGPSIRLAEAIAQQWGNIQFGIRELDQRNGESTVQAFAWDVETNTKREVTFQVPHIRYTRQGSKLLTDPRDIYEMVANQGARRVRSCILSIIPGDVVEEAVSQWERTLQTSIDISPESLQGMLDTFAEYNVTKEQIEKRIQCRFDKILPAQMVQIKKIYMSLRDGMSEPTDWFEMETEKQEQLESKPANSKTNAVKNKIGANSKKKETPKQEQEETESSQPQFTYAEIMDELNEAKDKDDLDLAISKATELPEDQKNELNDHYEKRCTEVGK